MLFLEGFVINYISAAYFDFYSTSWYSEALGYYEYSPHVSSSFKQTRSYPSSILSMTHAQSMQSSSLGTTCHRDEDFLFESKPNHILLSIN